MYAFADEFHPVEHIHYARFEKFLRHVEVAIRQLVAEMFTLSSPGWYMPHRFAYRRIIRHPSETKSSGSITLI